MSEFKKYQRMGAYHWAQTKAEPGNRAFNAPLAARYSRLTSLTPPGPGPVLDAGCGDGYLMHLLLQKGFSPVLGVDLNRVGVGLAHEQLALKHAADQWQAAPASLMELPFGDASLAGVVLADVIEHLEEPGKALAEIKRVLKPGGWLAVSTPQRQPDMVWDKLHVTEYSAAEFHGLLERFFTRVDMKACWPMWAYRLWSRGGRAKSLLLRLSLRGLNPFALSLGGMAGHGQLMALCRKGGRSD